MPDMYTKAEVDRKIDDLWQTIFAIEKCVAMKFQIPKTATECLRQEQQRPEPDSAEKIAHEPEKH